MPSAVTYGKSGDKWIAVPIVYGANMQNYRIEASKKAGFSKFPGRTDEFLEYAKAMKAQGTPGGFALGHDPVFAARPPNRRSRLAYSAMALSSAALSKSGQWIGTKTSSL